MFARMDPYRRQERRYATGSGRTTGTSRGAPAEPDIFLVLAVLTYLRRWPPPQPLPGARVDRMAERTRFEGDLEPDEDYEGLRFTDATFDEAAAGGCHFLDCEFTGVSFADSRLRKSRFTDAALRDTRFVATDLAETSWQDTTLASCALAGVQAFSAGLRRVTFRDGKLDSVNFRGAVFTDVAFEDCVLRDADFGSATLLRVSFAGCTLTGADFTKASCTKVDLRGAQLGITAGYESLRGVTIDSVQLVTLAPYLARHLGITVAD